MRYILTDDGYIDEISFGNPLECKNKNCIEYTGSIPTGYTSLEEWSENANIQAYKVENGNLVYYQAKATELQTLWNNQRNSNKPLTANDIYPVGSIYMSVNNINPTNLFGGTWEQIKDTFLLACGNTYSNGATGGSTTTDAHAITINEMPEHGHYIKATYGEKQWALGYLWSRGAGPSDGNTIGGQTDSINTGKTGKSQGHTHTFMPPYLAVYVWKRTA